MTTNNAHLKTPFIVNTKANVTDALSRMDINIDVAAGHTRKQTSTNLTGLLTLELWSKNQDGDRLLCGARIDFGTVSASILCLLDAKF